jgi:hypothetical protein
MPHQRLGENMYLNLKPHWAPLCRQPDHRFRSLTRIRSTDGCTSIRHQIYNGLSVGNYDKLQLRSGGAWGNRSQTCSILSERIYNTAPEACSARDFRQGPKLNRRRNPYLFTDYIV